ncbi:MAG: hypothetical protein ACP5KI_01770 [Brevinematia bacterium]|jgi:hypothetical protein
MSKVRVRQSKNRLRSKLTEDEIKELRRKIRDPSYIDHVTSQLASIIFSRLSDKIDDFLLHENESSQKSNLRSPL